MKEIPALSSYKELSERLQENRSSFGAAQVHGLLCGLICSHTARTLSPAWIKKILGSSKNQSDLELLHSVYETSYHLLSEFSFEFTLLLSDDNHDLAVRTEELGLWCQGFLTGLGDYATKPSQNEEVTEAINDITEIAQVNFDDTSDNDENETAYFELVEYIRLAVLMLFQELRPKKERSLH